MTDDFRTIPLSEDLMAKLRDETGTGLDRGQIEVLRKGVLTKYKGTWELDHVRVDEQVAVLKRVRVLTEVSTGVDGVVTVSPQDRAISDGKKFAQWAKMHHADLEVLSFNPLTRQGQLGQMKSDVTRCREAVAQVVGADPWDVPVMVTRDTSTDEAVRFDLKLPSYFPSKHLEGLNEVATEIVGDYRWTVKVDAQTKDCAMELVPDKLDRPIPWVVEQTDLPKGVRIGETADGEPWRLPIIGTHTLVVAQTSWGKGSVLWGLVRGLGPAIAAGTVVVWIVDLKGGVEAATGREFFGRIATNHETATNMLRSARMLMDARLKAMGEQRVRQHVPTKADPALVLIFDEFTALRLAAPDNKAKAAAEAELTLLLSQGRAANVLVSAFLQSPKASDVPARDFFPRRVLGKIPNRRMIDTILGDMATAHGADVTKLPDRLKGVFYTASDGGAPPIRCRAHYSTDDAIMSDAAVVERGAKAGQAVLAELLASLTPGDDETAQTDGAATPMVDAGHWRPTDREACTSCDTPLLMPAGICPKCTA